MNKWNWGSATSAVLTFLLVLCLPGMYRYGQDFPLAAPHERRVFEIAVSLYALLLAGFIFWTVRPHTLEPVRRNLAALLGTLFILGGAEAVATLCIPADAAHVGLIFPPHSSAHYESSEFIFDAHVNNLGFRDRDFPLVKTTRYRILAIGDSTTYGWGVDIEKAWPKVLERELRARGLDVEVLDLGKPGVGPVQYADLAEKAVPLLKPDLVLVDLLQGDDLAQSNNEEHKQTPLGHLASRPVEEIYPTLSRWVTNQTIMHTQQTGPEWRQEVATMIRGLNDEQRQHYATIDPSVRALWESGKLSPGSFVTGVKYWTYFTATVDPDSAISQLLTRGCGQALTRIKQVAAANNARVLALSLPWDPYVGQREADNFKRLGIAVDPRMWTTDTADEAFRRACAAADVPFITHTAELRRDREPLFYPLDGHFNVYGNDFFAHLVLPDIAQSIGDARARSTR